MEAGTTGQKRCGIICALKSSPELIRLALWFRAAVALVIAQRFVTLVYHFSGHWIDYPLVVPVVPTVDEPNFLREPLQFERPVSALKTMKERLAATSTASLALERCLRLDRCG